MVPGKPNTRAISRAAYLLTAIAVPLSLAGAAERAEHEFRVRLAWGGASRVAWHGSLTLPEGRIVDFAPLGAEADVPGTFVRVEQGLAFSPLRPMVYQAVDVTVIAPRTAALRLELSTARGTPPVFAQLISLADLWEAPLNQKIDSAGNRLLVRPSPGDELRVRFARDHLVFRPRETWQLDILPREDLRRQAAAKLQVEILPKGTRRAVWRKQFPLKAGPDGLLPASESISLPLPAQTGVFDLMIRLSPSSSGVPFGPRDRSAERPLQFVVVDDRPSQGDDETIPEIRKWPEVISFDPSQPKWWERITPVAMWNRLPGEFGDCLRSGTATPWQREEGIFSRLDPGGWQALPLTVRSVGQPHILEVKYPRPLEQSLAICVLEANERGEIYWRVPTSAFTRTNLPGESSGSSTYRMLFWPRTRRPVALLMNLAPQGPAAYGPIRVLGGPAHLPSAFAGALPVAQRTAMAMFDEPSFIDMFSATDAIDPESGRPLTDWETFLDSSLRLAEYLKFVGLSGASVGVWCDGSGIYPAVPSQGASRYDTGPFFPTGQDPVRKDVAELLFRVFDREGLKLVPGLRFTSRLPELERQLHSQAEPVTGIELTNRAGQSWRELHGEREGKGSFYNPLDPRVQFAMSQVVRDLVRRYGHHPSFAGVRLDLGPNTYSVLPDLSWGYDAATLAAYRADRGQQGGTDRLPSAATETPATLESSSDWWKWRAERLTRLYEGMARDVERMRPEARLYLSASRIIDAPAIRRAATPSLSRRESLEKALLAMGLDVPRLLTARGIVFPRPMAQLSSDSLVSQGPAVEFTRDPGVDTLFTKARKPAGLVLGRPQLVPLPQPAHPAGASPTQPARWVMVSADRLGALQREHLARSVVLNDAETLFVGGWRPSLGQPDALSDFIRVFRELPASPFTSVSETESSPVVVRVLSQGDKSQVYAVNQSPWTAHCQLDFDVTPGTRLTPLASGMADVPVADDRGALSWQFDVKGYGLIAATLSSSNVQVRQVRQALPDDVPGQLRATISDITDRIAQLRQVDPSWALANAGFEQLEEREGVPGWELYADGGNLASLDHTQFRSGTSSLHLRTQQGSCWVRSQPIEPPRTGRLSLHVHLKAAPGSTGPVRLAIEGLYEGQSFARHAEIEAIESANAAEEWHPFVLQVSDLPDRNLRDLRVRIEMRGTGDIWIDDVQLSEWGFTPAEFTELQNVMALAELRWSKGNLAECRQTLQRYWPRFLLTYAPPPSAEIASRPATQSLRQPQAPRKEESNFLEQVRKIFPPVSR